MLARPFLIRPILTALGLALLPVAAASVEANTTPRTPAKSYQARMALHKYFRALAAGDRAACGYMAPELLMTFGPEGCSPYWAREHAELDDEDIARYRHVTVPAAVRIKHDILVVRHRDLDWKGGPVSLESGSESMLAALPYYILIWSRDQGWRVGVPASSDVSDWVERDSKRFE